MDTGYGIPWREITTDAIRYWERRRPAYNLVLTAIVLLELVPHLPAVPHRLLSEGLALFALAVIANVLYSSAYVVDVFVQVSGFREAWRGRRWILFLLGLGLAAVLTHVVASGVLLPDT